MALLGRPQLPAPWPWAFTKFFRLLNHPIYPKQERLGKCEPYALGSLEIDDQFELDRLFDGQVGGLCSSEYLADEGCCPEIEISIVDAVRDQAPFIDKLPCCVHGRD